MKFRIFGLVHHTHPSAAQSLDDAVMRDGLVNHVFPLLPRLSGAPVIVRRSDGNAAGITSKRWPEVEVNVNNPQPTPPRHLTFARFAARLSRGTRSCVSRLRVPSVLGG